MSTTMDCSEMTYRHARGEGTVHANSKPSDPARFAVGTGAFLRYEIVAQRPRLELRQAGRSCNKT